MLVGVNTKAPKLDRYNDYHPDGPGRPLDFFDLISEIFAILKEFFSSQKGSQTMENLKSRFIRVESDQNN